jgi:hypothetical protein
MSHVKIIGLAPMDLICTENFDWADLVAPHQEQIEVVWRQESQKRGRDLFNGKMFNFIGYKQEADRLVVTGHFIQYKEFIAKRVLPYLPYTVTPVGVSGLTYYQQGEEGAVLMARRSHGVTQYPGFFELLPSGTIDPDCLEEGGKVDYIKKIRDEFSEESGLEKSNIKNCTGFALLHDSAESCYDLCSIIEITPFAGEQLEKNFHRSGEYDRLIRVNFRDMEPFLEKNAPLILPTSLSLYRAFIASWHQQRPL